MDRHDYLKKDSLFYFGIIVDLVDLQIMIHFLVSASQGCQFLLYIIRGGSLLPRAVVLHR